eukprot:2041126-Pyramimonas_sp.AAC.1
MLDGVCADARGVRVDVRGGPCGCWTGFVWMLEGVRADGTGLGGAREGDPLLLAVHLCIHLFDRYDTIGKPWATPIIITKSTDSRELGWPHVLPSVCVAHSVIDGDADLGQRQRSRRAKATRCCSPKLSRSAHCSTASSPPTRSTTPCAAGTYSQGALSSRPP